MEVTILNKFIMIWKILKGSVHYRFATFLIVMGIGVLSGPTLIQMMIIHVFEMSAEHLGSPVSPFWENVVRVVGLTLILAGVATYFIGESKGPQLDDYIDFTIPSGWSFRDAADAICRDRSLEFDGFSDNELDAELLPQELKSFDVIDAFNGIQLKNPNLPKYDVFEDRHKITLRKRNAN